MRYNDKFKLNPKQIALIETALHRYPDSREEVRELLAHLYHQKNWYRPKKGTYVSG